MHRDREEKETAAIDDKLDSQVCLRSTDLAPQVLRLLRTTLTTITTSSSGTTANVPGDSVPEGRYQR